MCELIKGQCTQLPQYIAVNHHANDPPFVVGSFVNDRTPNYRRIWAIAAIRYFGRNMRREVKEPSADETTLFRVGSFARI